jgi:Asp-tRNA(Asn)/Glu-tRNA(Gln) amidotransferase A subunit family amidase
LPYSATVSTVISAEGSTAFASLIESDRFEELIDAKQKAGLRAGLLLTAREYLDAMRIRSQVCEAFRALFRDVDVLVSGARGAPASGIDEALDTRRGQSSGGDGDSPQRPNNASLIAASNLAGLPALSIPCGFSVEGLPLGLQLVGPPFSENRLLALGVWFQSQTDWHLRRPPEPRTSTRT